MTIKALHIKWTYKKNYGASWVAFITFPNDTFVPHSTFEFRRLHPDSPRVCSCMGSVKSSCTSPVNSTKNKTVAQCCVCGERKTNIIFCQYFSHLVVFQIGTHSNLGWVGPLRKKYIWTQFQEIQSYYIPDTPWDGKNVRVFKHLCNQHRKHFRE